jgi:two-component system cell cycle sensor histidine kinase/response regulator CckA
MMTSIWSKLSEEQLERLLLQFKYHDAVKRVARGVTHNYNNIFTGLTGQTAMLRQETKLLGDLADKRSELMAELLQRGIEQTAILFGFTRDADGENRSQSPLLVASRAVELLNTISRVHRFLLHSELKQEKFLGNVRDITLLLFYLGENCVDATPQGGTVYLDIGWEEHGPVDSERGLAFRFRDHGQGFADNLPLSFKTPFVTSKTDSPFRGLGMYSARILAARYNGHLTVFRNQDKETVVSAVFPAAMQEVTAPATVLAGQKPQPEEPCLTKQCFLVVEDDESMRTLLLNRLQRRGHMVFCVDTCAEALEEYHYLHDTITTVLMDVGLQDDSGYECHRKILAINPRARIIFMSGQFEVAPAELAGKSIFLQKPFTIDQLEKAVHDAHV